MKRLVSNQLGHSPVVDQLTVGMLQPAEVSEPRFPSLDATTQL